MKSVEKWEGQTALITGASSGIGQAFARLLAQAGCHLILTARRREKLEALARELSAGHGIQVEVVGLDLSEPGAAAKLHKQVQVLKREVRLLINNAGVGVSGPFQENSWEEEARMIQLNAVALAELTKLFLPGMLARGNGDILMVSSIAAFMPVPTFALYSATKAFVTHFGEALGHELRNTGVNVTVVNPGGTATEFLEAARIVPSKMAQRGMMSPVKVARRGLEAMARGRPSIIPGVGNSIMIELGRRLLPLGLRLKASALFQRIVES